VVKAVVYHPLLFAKRRMEDDNEDRPIRLKYFGVFLQKFVKTKEHLMQKRHEYLVKNISTVFEAVVSTGRFDHMTSEQDLIRILNYMLDNRDREGLTDFWGIYQEHIK
jgi:hypothetical protein